MTLPLADLPKTSSQQKKIYLPQRHRGQGIRDKDRRQKTRKKGKRICPAVGRGTKEALAREDTGEAHREMVYKGKGETLF